MRRAYFWGKVQDGVFPRGEKGWGRLGPGWAVGTSTRRCPEFAHVHSMASDTPSQEMGGQGPGPHGLMRPGLRPMSRGRCEGMLRSLPAQQLTRVLGRGMWDLPGPGIQPVFPTLAGSFFTTNHQGSPWWGFPGGVLLSYQI